MDSIQQQQIPTLMVTFFISRLVNTFLAPTRQSAGLLKGLKTTLALR
jgi:hypothetical protein